MNNILIRLRQACCHPYLLPGQEPEVGRGAAATAESWNREQPGEGQVGEGEGGAAAERVVGACACWRACRSSCAACRLAKARCPGCTHRAPFGTAVAGVAWSGVPGRGPGARSAGRKGPAPIGGRQPPILRCPVTPGCITSSLPLYSRSH